MPSLFSPWHFVIRKQGVKHSRVRLGAAVHPTDRIYCKLVYIQCVRLPASMCECMWCRLLFIQTNINLNDWHLLERTCCSLEYFVFVELYVCCHCCNCFFFCCCCRFLICIYLVTPRTKGKETKAWNQPTKSSKHLTNANFMYIYLCCCCCCFCRCFAIQIVALKVDVILLMIANTMLICISLKGRWGVYK